MIRSPSPAQRAVLEWLLAYPSVEISWNGEGTRPDWTVWWASEQARLHMVRAMTILGADISDTAAKVRPLEGATPPIIQGTFRVLRERGWIKPVKWDNRRGTLYFQISKAGVLAIRPLPAKEERAGG